MGCKCKDCKCKEMTNEQVIEQMDDQRRPFTEEVFTHWNHDSEVKIRHFDHTASDHLYKWHWDEEDRWIEAQHENDWKFQFDNELPQDIPPGKIIQIPKGAIHRLIKGTDNLSISITS